jgi:uncharacterized radical SAM superfamily Fe-S cluster-containing enzyme
MIITFTNQCQMQCTHCFVDSQKSGEFLDQTTLANIVHFMDQTNPYFVQISGGEFTEHPHFFEFLWTIIQFLASHQKPTKLILLSNGTYIFDSTKEAYMKQLLGNPYVAYLQITSILPYYPNFHKEIHQYFAEDHRNVPKLEYWEKKRPLIPLGRARNLPEAQNSMLRPSKFDSRHTNYGGELMQTVY